MVAHRSQDFFCITNRNERDEFSFICHVKRIKSMKFAEHYQRVARNYGCHFLDASKVVVSSDLDGVHFEADQHRKLGQAVAARVREILK